MSHVFYEALEKRANLVNMFKRQQAARAAAKKARFKDAMSSAMSRTRKGNSPVDMFKQQQAARAAAKKSRLGDAVNSMRQRNSKADLVARFKQQQAARAAMRG